MKYNSCEVVLFQGVLRIIYSAIFLFSGLGFVQAAENDCPTKITAIEGDPLGDAAGKILISVYEELGCQVTILKRPGLRGVAEFNKRRVDGELYRLELVEPAYERDFIRSRTALFSLRNAMWVHPDTANISTSKNIGYVPGIRWHEQVVEEQAKGYIFEPFHTEGDMHKAYSDEKIVGFLSEKQTVDLLIDQAWFVDYPVEAHSFGARPLYHYLGLEFIRFMDRFSDYIAKENPYQHLN